MSLVGATSKFNILFFIYHTFFLSTPLLSIIHLTPPAPTGTSSLFSFFGVCGGGGRGLQFSRRNTLSILMRCTEYVMANREQPSCVVMQTLDCWLDRI